MLRDPCSGFIFHKWENKHFFSDVIRSINEFPIVKYDLKTKTKCLHFPQGCASVHFGETGQKMFPVYSNSLHVVVCFVFFLQMSLQVLYQSYKQFIIETERPKRKGSKVRIKTNVKNKLCPALSYSAVCEIVAVLCLERYFTRSLFTPLRKGNGCRPWVEPQTTPSAKNFTC